MPNSTTSSAAAQARRSWCGSTAEEKPRARDAAHDRRKQEHPRRRQVDVENLLHEPHRRFVWRVGDEERRHREHHGADNGGGGEPLGHGGALVFSLSLSLVSSSASRRTPEPKTELRHRVQSVITGSNVQSASVTNTTSKHTSKASQKRTIVGVELGLEQRRGRTNTGNDDWNGDRIQQHRQQHVAVRARTSIAANSVPTAAKPTVPERRTAASQTAGRAAAPGTATPRAARARSPRRPVAPRYPGACRRRSPAVRLVRGAAPASVSDCRSRSNARPSASVPAKAIEIHRMPAAPSSGARPSRTRAKAKTSTHETAKKSVVYAISRLRTSTVRSLRSTSQTTRANMATSPPASRQACRAAGHDIAVRRPQRVGAIHGGHHPAIAEKHRAIEQPFRKVEIVRGHDDDGAVVAKGP